MPLRRGIEVAENEDGSIMVRVSGENVGYMKDSRRKGGRRSVWWMFYADGTPMVNFEDDPYVDWAWALYENNFQLLLDGLDETSFEARLEKDPVLALQRQVVQLKREVADLRKRKNRSKAGS